MPLPFILNSHRLHITSGTIAISQSRSHGDERMEITKLMVSRTALIHLTEETVWYFNQNYSTENECKDETQVLHPMFIWFTKIKILPCFDMRLIL